MERNYSASPFLRIPPEIRLQIYGLVLGGQKIWIGHRRSEVDDTRGWPGQYFHKGGYFYHHTASPFDKANPLDNLLNIPLLRVCRHVYTETALLPYKLNTFTFDNDSTRKLFEQSTRKAIGEYDIES